MDVFPTDAGVPLCWTQPDTEKKVFELQAKEKIVAWLSFEKAGGSKAVAEITGARWIFERKKQLDPVVYIHEAEEKLLVATFKPKWTAASGIIEFGDKRSYIWKQTNLWSAEYVFSARDGEQVVSFKSTGPFKHSVSVGLHQKPAACEELSLLTLFGWYLILLYWDDSTAITAAINAATM